MNERIKKLIGFLDEGWSPRVAMQKAGITHHEWRKCKDPGLKVIKEYCKEQREKKRTRMYEK
jgi:hypothetical protein